MRLATIAPNEIAAEQRPLFGLQQAELANWPAMLAPRATVAMRTESHEAAVLAALHDTGLAGLGRFRADRETGLVHVEALSTVPDLDIWTVVHRHSRDVARIRAVLTHITTSMQSQASAPRPGTPS